MTAAAAGVFGLDLSLTAAASCYLPPSWRPSEPTRGVLFDVHGYPLLRDASPEQVGKRLDDIADGVVRFVAREARRTWRPGATSVYVFVEGYAYGLAAMSGVVLAELGGAVKAALYRELSAGATPISQSRARTYLVGKIPRGKGEGQKRVGAALRQLGFEFTASDPGDAFVIANAGRAELGLPGVSLA